MDEEKNTQESTQDSETSRNEYCETVILSDEPSEIDLFGTHESIAKAISSLIGSEKVGKSIALQGPWGSGKSTVLKILKRKLPDNVKLYIFDAWAHHEDALRMSFLEDLFYEYINLQEEERGQNDTTLLKLLGDIQKFLFKKTNAQKWNEFSESITSSQSNQSTTLLGFLIIFIGMAIALSSKIYDNYQSVSNMLLWFILMSLIILLIIIIAGFLGKPKLNTLIQSTTTHCDSPSSIKFRNKFNELIRRILAKKISKLVIVVDNLDRVDCEQARSIWATMRTFFYQGDRKKKGEKEDRFYNTWLLVPFSPEMPDRLWTGAQNRCILLDETEKKKAGNCTNYASSFVEKTFQLIFHIPPLSPSDWETFLKEKLAMAFPSHKPIEFHSIYSLYCSIKARENNIPTPRELILFTNNIAAFHLIWNDTIPLVQQAYYVLRSDQFPKIIADMDTENFTDRYLVAYLGEGYKDNLACLHTGLKTEKARQIILKNRLENAIRNLQFQEFNSMSSEHNFYSTLLITIENSTRKSGDANFVINTALCLESLGEKGINFYITDSWGFLSSSLKYSKNRITSWPYDQRTGEGLIAIVKHAQGDEKIELVRRATLIISEITYQRSDSVDLSIVSNWTRRALYFLDKAEKLGFIDILKENFAFLDKPYANFNATLQSYITLGTLNVSKSLMILFHPQKDNVQGLLDHIVEYYKSQALSDIAANAISFMVKLDIDWNWKKLIDWCANQIQTDDSITWRLNAYYKTLFVLKYSSNMEAKNELRIIKVRGYNEYHLFNTKDVLETASILIFNNFENDEGTSEIKIDQKIVHEGIVFYQKFRAYPDQYPELIAEFTELLIKYDRIGYLIDSYERNYNKNLVRHVLDKLVDDDRVKSIFIQQIMDKYEEKLLQILGEERFRQLLDKLDKAKHPLDEWP